MSCTNRPFIVERTGDGIFVLRDDLIPGGTKRRGLDIMLQKISHNHIFYAGTVKGHGALALSHACREAGKQAHIFLTGREDDPMVQQIVSSGASLYRNDSGRIEDLYNNARQASFDMPDSVVFTPGFDMPDFISALTEALAPFDASPYSEIWTSAVSGTLTRALETTLNKKIFKTVSVVKSQYATGVAHIYKAPEKYHRMALNPPPYPACPYTDAKVWQFAHKLAAPGALIWNTAG